MRKMFIVIIVFCLSLTGLVKADLLDGLEAYWPLEGDFADASGNGHDGVPRSPGAITFEQGIQGLGILSDGTNPNGIDCGTWNPSEVTGQLSLSIWTKWNGSNGGYQGLFSKRNSYGDDYWTFEVNADTDVLGFFRADMWGVPSGGTVLEIGVWSHVALSFDGTDATYYVNGQKKGVGSFSFGTKPEAWVNIGSSDNWNGWNGAIDEAVIWNRAITTEEVEELYNDGRGLDLMGFNWKAINPEPSDGAVGISDEGVTLRWDPPLEENAPPKPITEYDVYFSSNALPIDEPNGLEAYVGTVLVDSVLELVIADVELEKDMEYFWRVDAVIDRDFYEGADPNIALGDTWSFETLKSTPVIDAQPQDVLVELGGTAVLSVGISSLSAHETTWYKVGPVVDTHVGTGDTLSITDVGTDDVGQYYAIALNEAGFSPESNTVDLAIANMLVAHITADDDLSSGTMVLDSSIFGHNGTSNGDPESIEGIIGNAFLFDGNTDGSGPDWIDLGTWNPSAVSGQLSISLWAKWTGLNDGWQGLIGKRDSWGSSSMMWHIELSKDDGIMSFGRDGNLLPNNEYVLPEGQWVHVAVVYDGTTATTYANGSPIASGPFTFGTPADTALVIGAVELDGGNPFNGALDDVRIYNYAITPEDVAQLYTSVTGETVCLGFNQYDFNQNCVVDLADLMVLVQDGWLKCNIVPDCIP